MKKILTAACVAASMFTAAVCPAVNASPLDGMEEKLMSYGFRAVGGTGYYNAYDEWVQVKDYINNGYYLEAMYLCDEVLKNNLSPDDIGKFSEFRSKAYQAYENYKIFMKNPEDWPAGYIYAVDWGLGLMTGVDFESEYFYFPEEDCSKLTVYRTKDAYINIMSYPNKTTYTWGSWGNPNNWQVMADRLKYEEEISHQDAEYGSWFEVLSKSPTTVGIIPADQVVIRTSKFANQGQTHANSYMTRYNIFTYKDYTYVVEYTQFADNWSDGFWNIMENVRTSIGFYPIPKKTL